jgi:hypothetical protein
MQVEGQTVAGKPGDEKTPGEEPKKFRDLTAKEKLRFVAKVFVFILSFGYIFPTLLSD